MAEPLAINVSFLIDLARAGLVDFLQLVAETIVVSATVTAEIRRQGPLDTVQALQNSAWIVQIDDLPIPKVIQAWDLGKVDRLFLHGIQTSWYRGYCRRFGRPTLCNLSWCSSMAKPPLCIRSLDGVQG